jgi:hypothetical protein
MGTVALKQAAEATDGRGIVSRRDSFGWRLDGNKAVDVIRAVYPYLVAKRKQACLAYTLDRLNKHGHGSRAVPSDVQEKKALLKDLINRCNQREHVDLPSWIEEPKQEVEPGWYLRSDIIWHKPNPMPESVRDRPTKSHEYVFLLSTQPRYYFDAEGVREDAEYGRRPGMNFARVRLADPRDSRNPPPDNVHGGDPSTGRNIRSVWTIATAPFSGAHFATFPPDLVIPCIKAGTSERGACPACGSPWVRVVERGESSWEARKTEGDPIRYGLNGTASATSKRSFADDAHRAAGGLGVPAVHQTTGWQPSCTCDAGDPAPCTVLDPFAGAGTTGLVADRLGRDAILIELNAEYAAMARRRITGDAPLFASVT